jgi:hypothetical protein
MWTYGGIPHDLEGKVDMLKGQNFLHRKGDVLVQIWKEGKRVVHMISIIYVSKFMSQGRKKF